MLTPITTKAAWILHFGFVLSSVKPRPAPALCAPAPSGTNRNTHRQKQDHRPVDTDGCLFITVSFCLPLFFFLTPSHFFSVEPICRRGGSTQALERRREAPQYSSYCKNNKTEMALAHKNSFPAYFDDIFMFVWGGLFLCVHTPECT